MKEKRPSHLKSKWHWVGLMGNSRLPSIRICARNGNSDPVEQARQMLTSWSYHRQVQDTFTNPRQMKRTLSFKSLLEMRCLSLQYRSLRSRRLTRKILEEFLDTVVLQVYHWLVCEIITQKCTQYNFGAKQRASLATHRWSVHSSWVRTNAAGRPGPLGLGVGAELRRMVPDGACQGELQCWFAERQGSNSSPFGPSDSRPKALTVSTGQKSQDGLVDSYYKPTFG